VEVEALGFGKAMDGCLTLILMDGSSGTADSTRDEDVQMIKDKLRDINKLQVQMVSLDSNL